MWAWAEVWNLVKTKVSFSSTQPWEVFSQPFLSFHDFPFNVVADSNKVCQMLIWIFKNSTNHPSAAPVIFADLFVWHRGGLQGPQCLWCLQGGTQPKAHLMFPHSTTPFLSDFHLSTCLQVSKWGKKKKGEEVLLAICFKWWVSANEHLLLCCLLWLFSFLAVVGNH